MNKSPEFEQGVSAKLNRETEFDNPYRDNGTSEQFQDWLDGWLFVE
jgi:hypothetical protein